LWPSVCYAFTQSGALLNVPVSARTSSEQLHGINKERDEVRKVESFIDLWKFFAQKARAVRTVYAFRDIFDALAFGQSA
jgi:hypothetical protein